MTNKVCVIVDSNQLFREQLAEWLKLEFPNIQFCEAQNGVNALELSQEHRPTLIILDIELPDMSGFDLIGQFKKKKIKTAFILLSLRTDKTYRETAGNLNVLSFIPKNAAHLHLISSMKRVFNEEYSVSQNTLQR
jgi:DNA-binding NarL/FixJ family response regulator